MNATQKSVGLFGEGREERKGSLLLFYLLFTYIAAAAAAAAAAFCISAWGRYTITV